MSKDNIKLQKNDVFTLCVILSHFGIAKAFQPLGKIGGWILLFALFFSGISYYKSIKKECGLKWQPWWYAIFLENSFVLQLLVLEFLDLNGANPIRYISAILLVVSFIWFFIWTSRMCFKNTFHGINIIIVSTFAILFLSYIFSLYYKIKYNMNYSFDYSGNYGWFNLFYRYWSFGKNSFSGFFEFPTREYLDIISFGQFMLGRLYDSVFVAGIANIIIIKIGLSVKEDDSNSKNKKHKKK